MTDDVFSMPAAPKLVPDEAQCHICLHTRSIGEMGQEMVGPDTAAWRCLSFHDCAAIIHACAQGEHDHKPMHAHHMRAVAAHLPEGGQPVHVVRHGLLLSRMVERRAELGIAEPHHDPVAGRHSVAAAFLHAVLTSPPSPPGIPTAD